MIATQKILSEIQMPRLKIVQMTIFYILWCNIGPLLHKTAPVMPEAIVKGQFILKLLGLIYTGVWVLPLKWGQPEIKKN